MPTVDGKVAIVTGAASGVGLACANRLAADGARIVLADVDDEAGEEAASALAGSIGAARFVHCDVARKLDVRNMVTYAVDAFGRADILINNAGSISAGDFLKISENDFQAALKSNLTGTFMVSQAVAKLMIEQVNAGDEPGVIVNMSSISGLLSDTRHLAYSVAKAGIDQLTRSMALALAPHRIRVNAIGLGAVKTAMPEDIVDDEDAQDLIIGHTPLARFGEPEEIAAIAAFLVSSEASYITGQTIYADGGRMALDPAAPGG